MPTFTYVARDRSGQRLQSSIDAATPREVASVLRAKGYFVSEIRERQVGTGLQRPLPTPRARIGLRDVTVFSRQFATVINAGLPVVQSLHILARQAEKVRMREVLQRVREDVETGQPLSDAMARHPRVFSRLYLHLVRAGEMSGNLDGILERVAQYLEKQAAIRGKLRNAMTYPVVVLVIALAVTYFLLTAVVPQFAGILRDLGGDLPLVTQVLMTVSTFLRDFWWLLALLVAGLMVGVSLAYRNDRGRMMLDAAALRVPVLGLLLRKSAIASFSNTFGLLLRSGVNIIESIDITKGTAGNRVIEGILEETRDGVQRGEQVSMTLARHAGVFPPLVSSMIAIGEETGQVDTMLAKITQYYEREVDEAVAGLTAALEPMLVLFLGGVVAFIVAGMFLPMFAIMNQLGV